LGRAGARRLARAASIHPEVALLPPLAPRLRFALSGAVLALTLLVGAGGAAHASCVPLTPADMFLDGATVPAGEIGVDITQVDLAVPGTASFPPTAGSVVGLHILPPEMLSAGDAYVPNVDYSACIDDTTGQGFIHFAADGSYLVRVDYASGPSQYFIVDVATKNLTQCFEAGSLKEFACPAPPKAYEGTDVADP